MSPVADERGDAREGTSGAAGGQQQEARAREPAPPLAVAPTFSRTIGCQSKMSWKDMEAERER